MAAKRFLLGFLVVVFGIAAVGCATQPQVQENKPSINSVGTGFFISADGYIITCAHVVEDARVIGIWIGENRYRAELVGLDKDTDVAILKINHRPSRFFRLANFASAKIGDRVYALGFPLTHLLGSEIRATDGIISAFSGFRSDQSNFQISAPIQPGNSGGPVFNTNFEVLGIASSKLNNDSATNVSFAVKNTYITSLLPHDARIAGGNVRTMQDAVRATVQIFIDDVFDGPPITIVNNTGNRVASVYISQTASDVWGPDRLASDQILRNGESIALNLPFPLNVVNRYDIQLVDTNGNNYRQMDVAVAANGRIVFTAGGGQSTSTGPSIIIVNNTGSTIYYVYISETTSDEWGPDRLASDQVIANNATASVHLPRPINQVDRYDIRVRDSNNVDYIKWDVRVKANGRIVFSSADKQ